MPNQYRSLITPDAQSGLTLAAQLASELHVQIELASAKIDRPGGMNYLVHAPTSKEITTGILYYAVAAANGGWSEEK